MISWQMVFALICGVGLSIMAWTERDDKYSFSFWSSVIIAGLNFLVVILDLMGYLD